MTVANDDANKAENQKTKGIKQVLRNKSIRVLFLLYIFLHKRKQISTCNFKTFEYN